LGLERRHAGLLLQEADHHAYGKRILDRDTADRVDRVEHAGLLNQEQRALARIGEAGADADAFVLLADADEARRLHLRERPPQAPAGGDVGDRDDELDAARHDLANDIGAREGRRAPLRARLDLHGSFPPGVLPTVTISAGGVAATSVHAVAANGELRVA